MRLFDHGPRQDPTPARHLETHFPFLNRVATPFWAEVRRVLEAWFANVPEVDRSDLRARFRSPDNRQHVAAFWELYLHEVFIRIGFEVRLHPTLLGQTTSPDMLVERAGDSFYVEAIALTDKESEHQSARKRGQIYDALNERVASPNFFLNVESVAQGNRTPPLGKISRTVAEWLAELDPDAVPPFDQSKRDWALPTLEATFEGWAFRIQAIPKRSDRRVAEGPTVGMFGPPEAIFVNDHEDLHQRIGQKSRKYGEPDRPLLIAVLYARWTADAENMMRALFGGGWGHSGMLRSGRIEPTWPDDVDGVWLARSGPRNRNGSAILCALRLAPHSIAESSLWLVHHPWARKPLTTSLPFASMRVEPTTGRIVETQATSSAADLFRLPTKWPPGEPFPRKRHPS
jgi:hypothetical protein